MAIVLLFWASNFVIYVLRLKRGQPDSGVPKGTVANSLEGSKYRVTYSTAGGVCNLTTCASFSSEYQFSFVNYELHRTHIGTLQPNYEPLPNGENCVANRASELAGNICMGALLI